MKLGVETKLLKSATIHLQYGEPLVVDAEYWVESSCGLTVDFQNKRYELVENKEQHD